MKLPTEFIPLNDGTHICAPSNITLMTSYVLREQGDWFEDEIHFVRSFIKPGMAAIDIGANYGLYANAIGKKLGPKGRLWCFEPTPNTAEALRATIKKNKYKGRVKVVEAGLSSEAGSATFYMSPNAELNTLAPSEGAFMQQQTIALTTLDEFMREHTLPKVDFVKLDAEGEEVNILKGGAAFFAQHSPLLMFELMHVDQVNTELLAQVASLGYELFYLIPGLKVLAPFDLNKGYDDFLLNLFAIRSDRVADYSAQGLVVSEEEGFSALDVDQQALVQCRRLIGQNESLEMPEADSPYGRVLRCMVVALDTKHTSQIRFNHLMQAFTVIQSQDLATLSAEQLSSYARVAFEVGQRRFACHLLEQFLKSHVHKGLLPEPGQVYFLPLKVHDKQSLADDRRINLCAALVDSYIRMAHRSGYFAGAALMPYFAVLARLGARSPEMMRRESVLKARDSAMKVGR